MAANQTVTKYNFNSCIRGYHIYRTIWTSQIGEVLTCEIEPNNPHDKFAVSVKKGADIVGHVPREITKVFHYFIKRSGIVTCEVTGSKQNLGNGLEIPCVYTLKGEEKNVKKLPGLLKSKTK